MVTMATCFVVLVYSYIDRTPVSSGRKLDYYVALDNKFKEHDTHDGTDRPA